MLLCLQVLQKQKTAHDEDKKFILEGARLFVCHELVSDPRTPNICGDVLRTFFDAASQTCVLRMMYSSFVAVEVGKLGMLINCNAVPIIDDPQNTASHRRMEFIACTERFLPTHKMDPNNPHHHKEDPDLLKQITRSDAKFDQNLLDQFFFMHVKGAHAVLR